MACSGTGSRTSVSSGATTCGCWSNFEESQSPGFAEYVDVTRLDAGDRARASPISTLEVERVIDRPGRRATSDGNLGLFRVGRVLEAGKHPNADRAPALPVDVGEGEPRQIVCGAWNFGAGATVAVALPGRGAPDGRGARSTRRSSGGRSPRG